MALATPDAGLRGRPRPSPVVVVGLAMVLAHTGFRVWAQWGSWFFTDDYRLLLQAGERSLSWGYLTDPFDSQFMPMGRLLAWVVVESGTLSWQTAALITLALQVAAAAACLWMLLVLFGPRWGALAPLAVYLSSALPLPGFMWWAASVNQVPMQIVFFLAVGFWVRHLRSGRSIDLAFSLLVVAVGLTAYVKVLLVVPILAWIALAYFASGSALDRLRWVWLRRRAASVAGSALAAAYVVHYLVNVPQPFEETEGTPLLEVADTMLGTSLPTALLGGPWQWWNTNPPIVLVDPPDVAVHAVWVVLAALVAFSVLRRHNAGRAWVMFAGYAVVLYLLLATSRGQLFGSFAGLELRYLTDAAAAWSLTLGLAFMRLLDAPESSRPRETPLLTVEAPRALVVAGTAVVTVGGIYSSVGYVHFWHHENPSTAFTQNLRSSTAQLPLADVADRDLPEPVMPPYTQPYNRLSRFVQLMDHEVRFPAATHRPHLLGDDGRLRAADVEPRSDSGSGPRPGCGWQVRSGSRTLLLDGRTDSGDWWARIGYLASADTPMTVTAGGTRIETAVLQGLNELFVQMPEGVDRVTLGGLDAGATICVDRIVTGPLVAAEDAP